MANITRLDTRIVTRHDTEANWMANNPTLMPGEIAISVSELQDDGSYSLPKFKVGVDNILTWNEIPYCLDTSDLLNKINNVKPTTENTYFTEDMTLTHQFGKYIPDESGSVTVPTKDKSVYDALLDAFAESKDPDVDLPSASISVSGGSGEVGTTFTLPTATLTIDDVGSYTYGSKDSDGTKYAASETGVVFAASAVTVTCGDKSVSNTDTLGAGGKLTLKADGTNTVYGDDPVSFTFSATASYTESDRIPVNNLGSKVSEKKITSGSVEVESKTATFSGYRKPFWGYKLTADALAIADSDGNCSLTSAQIRGLGKSGSYQSDLPKTYSVPKDTKQVIFAAKKGTKSSLTVKNVTKEPATSVACVKYTDVDVEGANSSTSVAYDVWVINLDAAFTGQTNLSLTWG